MPIRQCSRCTAEHNRPGQSYCLACAAAYTREWRKTHPLNDEQRRKANARSYANVYLKRGKIKRGPCADCGVEHDPPLVTVEMHHPDYSKPLDIVWLCVECRGDRLRT